jgi:hypothetical protein
VAPAIIKPVPRWTAVQDGPPRRTRDLWINLPSPYPADVLVLPIGFVDNRYFINNHSEAHSGPRSQVRLGLELRLSSACGRWLNDVVSDGRLYWYLQRILLNRSCACWA